MSVLCVQLVIKQDAIVLQTFQHLMIEDIQPYSQDFENWTWFRDYMCISLIVVAMSITRICMHTKDIIIFTKYIVFHTISLTQTKTFKKYYICFFIKFEHVTSIKAVLEFNFVFCHGTWQNNKCKQFLKCKFNFMHKSSW